MRQNDKSFGKETVLERELTETELAHICGGVTGGPSSRGSESSPGQDLGELAPGGLVGMLDGVVNFAGLGLGTSTDTNSATPQSSSGLAGLLGALSGGSL